MITDDRHFKIIRKDGIIKIWSMTEDHRKITDFAISITLPRAKQEHSCAYICICTCRSTMARTIAVSDEVYRLLKRSKRPGESFSGVIKRSLGKRAALSDLIGRRTVNRDEWREAKSLLFVAQQRTAQMMTRR